MCWRRPACGGPQSRTYGDQLPTYRGDWTDFWNFGSISSAREQATNRNSRTRLRCADAAAAATLGLASPLATLHAARTMALYREEAWKALNLWDEHTWGADLSLRAPESEDTVSQWYHKAHFAYQARSLSLMLQRDALADLSRHVQRGSRERSAGLQSAALDAHDLWRGALPRGQPARHAR